MREFYATAYELVTSIPDGVCRTQGWPWSYATSAETDYTYAFEQGTLYVSCYGSPWVAIGDIDCGSLLDDYDFDDVDGPDPVFPDMRAPSLAVC